MYIVPALFPLHNIVLPLTVHGIQCRNTDTHKHIILPDVAVLPLFCSCCSNKASWNLEPDEMWRSQLGSKQVKTITQADDDDWETDPDFVVSHVTCH